MAELFKSTVMAVVRETTEGTLVDPSAGAEFIALREGFSFSGEVQTVATDTIKASDIGFDQEFVTNQTPNGSIPFYWKHSGTEGVEPEMGLFFEAIMGAKTVNGTEYTVQAASTASVINVTDGTQFEVGQALLVKDSAFTNGYAVRTIASISSNALTLDFDLPGVPTTGVGLGKAVLYKPGLSHPSFSIHRYQAASSSAFKDASAGNRATSLSLDFTANDLGNGTIDFSGIKFYKNQIRITAGSNDALDFNDGGGEEQATISAGLYNPHELAREIQSKMDALTTDNITVSFSNSTGKFTIASDGVTFSLLWNTGTNTATTIGAALGFSVAADDTGATSYVGDNALTYDPPVTPAYDSTGPVVIQNAQLLLGDSDQIDCRKATNVSVSISTPKTDVASICAENGIDSSVVLERESTLEAQMVLTEHEVGIFDKFVNNTAIKALLVMGPKSAGNREAGKTCAVSFLNASVTQYEIADNDGYYIVNVSLKGFVGSVGSDVYLNML